MRQIEIQFRKTMQRLIPDRMPSLVVACSGGVDSMVLLDLTRKYQLKSKHQVFAVYVHHNQRPDANEDAVLIQKYCKAHRLAFQALTTNAKPGASENTLRKARYEALLDFTQQNNAVLLTAHHAQDQLETYLFRLIRGAHPSSLKAIPEFSIRQEVQLVRPFLGFTKTEILSYARQKHVPWREDSTNTSLRYARNQIRHKLLPLLEELRPGACERLLAFFDNLSQNSIQKEPQSCPEEILKDAVSAQHAIKNIKNKIQSQPGIDIETIDFITLKSILDSLLGDKIQQTCRAHWENLKNHFVKRQAGAKKGHKSLYKRTLQFPGGHLVCFHGNRVFLSKEDSFKF